MTVLNKPLLRGSYTLKLALIVVLGLVFTTLVNLWASFPIVTSLAHLSSDSKQSEVLSEARLQFAEFHKVRRAALEAQIRTCIEKNTLQNCTVTYGSDEKALSVSDSQPVHLIPSLGLIEWPSETTVRVFDGTQWLERTFSFTPLKPLAENVASLLTAHEHLGLVIEGMKSSLQGTLIAASILGILVCLALIFVMSRQMRLQYNLLQKYIRSLAHGSTDPVPPGLVGAGELATLAGEVYGLSLERAQAQKQALEAERMSVWQTMARKVAHEIKNPLTPIALVGEQLGTLAGRIQDPRIQNLIDESSRIISEEAASLDRMVKEFTSFARLPKPQLKAEDIGSIVNDFISRNATPSGPQLKISKQVGAAPVLADASMIHQIMHNLTNNAHLSKLPLQVRVIFEIKDGNTHWHVDVIDDGPGVPPEIKEKMFDAYVTTRSTGEKAKGMGLGLTISRQIAIDHGGQLILINSDSNGTTMRLVLPKASEPKDVGREMEGRTQ